ncbi:hypothetical protein L914_19197 [Phytophthora nicotianae]|uniref:Uncharacterized protein n=1 Tax=Phytophthora nicotianae TaxID=4792 RepID=W2MB63_PHYNI|nr:hypothetical protein L914_19197 [Phytophthora nicotianae]
MPARIALAFCEEDVVVCNEEVEKSTDTEGSKVGAALLVVVFCTLLLFESVCCSSAETGTTCAPRWPGGGHWYSTSHHGTTSLLQLLDVDAGVDCLVEETTSPLVAQSASIFKDKRDFPEANPFLDRCGRDPRLRFGGAVIVVEGTTSKDSLSTLARPSLRFEGLSGPLVLSIMGASVWGEEDRSVLCLMTPQEDREPAVAPRGSSRAAAAF